MARFQMRLDPWWRGPLLLIGATPDRSYVDVDGEDLALHFGGHHEVIPRDNIKIATDRDWSMLYGIGVRLVPGGLIGYVGSTRGVVQLELRRPQRFRILFGWRLERTAVALSLTDPAGFLDALR